MDESESTSYFLDGARESNQALKEQMNEDISRLSNLDKVDVRFPLLGVGNLRGGHAQSREGYTTVQWNQRYSASPKIKEYDQEDVDYYLESHNQDIPFHEMMHAYMLQHNKFFSESGSYNQSQKTRAIGTVFQEFVASYAGVQMGRPKDEFVINPELDSRIAEEFEKIDGEGVIFEDEYEALYAEIGRRFGRIAAQNNSIRLDLGALIQMDPREVVQLLKDTKLQETSRTVPLLKEVKNGRGKSSHQVAEKILQSIIANPDYRAKARPEYLEDYRIRPDSFVPQGMLRRLGLRKRG